MTLNQMHTVLTLLYNKRLYTAEGFEVQKSSNTDTLGPWIATSRACQWLREKKFCDIELNMDDHAYVIVPNKETYRLGRICTRSKKSVPFSCMQHDSDSLKLLQDLREGASC